MPIVVLFVLAFSVLLLTLIVALEWLASGDIFLVSLQAHENSL
jgi:hypothetical protein